MSLGLCRLCASLRKQEVLTTIDDENQELCQKVHKCCQVEIRLGDKLPKSICSGCVQSLVTCYEFYNKVQESQETLSLLFGGQDSTSEQNQNLATSLASVVGNERTLKKEQAKPKAQTEPSPQEFKNDGENIKNTIEEVYELLEIDGNFTIDEVMEDEEVRDVEMQVQEESDTVEVISRDDVQEDFDEKAEHEEQEEEEEEECEKEDDDDEEFMVNEENDQSGFNGVISLNPVTKWSEYSWLCYLCSHSAPSRSALQYHALKLHNIMGYDVQYKCSDCQKISIRYHTFLNHVRLRHQPELGLCCDICDTRCKTFESLAKHRKHECAGIVEAGDDEDDDDDYENVTPTVQQCDKCPKCFHNLQALHVHLKVHSQGKQFKCNICKKSFKRACALRVHENLHSELISYTCDLCDRTFRQKANLDVHMYSHVNEKMYECKLCNKSFKTPTNLEKHALTHTDIKDFKCDHCEKEFRTRNAKLSHERTHTGEMPYPCKQCNRRFRFRSTLMAHTAAHSGEKPFTCVDCKVSFTNWSNFNKHLKRLHNTTASEWKKKEEARSMYSKKGKVTVEREKDTVVIVYTDEDSQATN